MNRTCVLVTLVATLLTPAEGRAQQAAYRAPPAALAEAVCGGGHHAVLVNPTGTWAVLAERPTCPPIAELARPVVRLAGLRFDPTNHAAMHTDVARALTIKRVDGGEEVPIDGLPANLRASDLEWSPDGTRLAFVQTGDTHVDLYVIDPALRSAAAVNGRPLNTVMGRTPGSNMVYAWIGPDAIIYRAVAGVGSCDVRPSVPGGPAVQESDGTPFADLSYRNVIASPHDERVFDCYSTVQFVVNRSGEEIAVGEPAVYESFRPSPDARYVLTTAIDKPYSSLVNHYAFAKTASVLDLDSQRVTVIATIPDRVGQRGPGTAPRWFQWRDDVPATLVWARALDPGDGDLNTPPGDAVFALDPPFTGEPRRLFETKLRFHAVHWGDDSLALVHEQGREEARYLRFDPSSGTIQPLVSWRLRGFDDHPGRPVIRTSASGGGILTLLDGRRPVFANPLGNVASGGAPFVAAVDPYGGGHRFLWHGAADRAETVDAVLADEDLALFRAGMDDTAIRYSVGRLSDPTDRRPVFEVRDPSRRIDGQIQVMAFRRADGVRLSGLLYLPSGYSPETDGRLPVLLWGYPGRPPSREAYRPSEPTAREIRKLHIHSWESPALWITQGYAVLEPDMPILPGPEGEHGNDSYVDQLRMNAEAAIDALAELGVGDPARVAVAGHSYGAAMTAVLLAHTRLFRAGIAFSGGYNRSTTPFRFQDEDRTYWDVPHVYDAMSALRHADRIEAPLLLIHGEADDVPGTGWEESEALYRAILGNGGIARYVRMPHEGHGFQARESLLHLLWEQHRWLELHVQAARTPTP